MRQEHLERAGEALGQGTASRRAGAAARRDEGANRAWRAELAAPPGPIVAASEGEREDLLWAMARVAGREGYRAASVEAAVAEAGSYPAAFEHHFADKLECYLAAHELLLGRALDAVGERFEADRPWVKRVIGGLERAVELCLANPELARALLVCPPEAGTGGQRCALETIERFAELIAPEAELAELVPPKAALMAASGVVGLIVEELARGTRAELAGLGPELGFALLVPLLGPIAAGEEILRVATAVD